jgi:hypothetical protein
MTFNDVKKELLYQKKTVTFKSLTSDKTHSLYCTIKKDFQKDSHKIVVWDILEDGFHDIEVSSILSIQEYDGSWYTSR